MNDSLLVFTSEYIYKFKNVIIFENFIEPVGIINENVCNISKGTDHLVSVKRIKTITN